MHIEFVKIMQMIQATYMRNIVIVIVIVNGIIHYNNII